MIKIKTNYDIENIRSEAISGFSGKEVVSAVLAVAVTLFITLFCYFAAGISPELGIYFGMPVSFVIVICGFYESKNKMTIREIVVTKLSNVFKDPLTYESTEDNPDIEYYLYEEEV